MNLSHVPVSALDGVTEYLTRSIIHLLLVTDCSGDYADFFKRLDFNLIQLSVWTTPTEVCSSWTDQKRAPMWLKSEGLRLTCRPVKSHRSSDYSWTLMTLPLHRMEKRWEDKISRHSFYEFKIFLGLCCRLISWQYRPSHSQVHDKWNETNKDLRFEWFLKLFV